MNGMRGGWLRFFVIAILAAALTLAILYAVWALAIR